MKKQIGLLFAPWESGRKSDREPPGYISKVNCAAENCAGWKSDHLPSRPNAHPVKSASRYFPFLWFSYLTSLFSSPIYHSGYTKFSVDFGVEISTFLQLYCTVQRRLLHKSRRPSSNQQEEFKTSVHFAAPSTKLCKLICRKRVVAIIGGKVFRPFLLLESCNDRVPSI